MQVLGPQAIKASMGIAGNNPVFLSGCQCFLAGLSLSCTAYPVLATAVVIGCGAVVTGD